MTIAQAETLKTEFTDKFVVVQDGVAELRRFTGLTGENRQHEWSGAGPVQ